MTKRTDQTKTAMNKTLNHKLPEIMKNSLIALLTFCIALLLPLTADAQMQTPADKQDRPIALTGGTIHTISGDVIENGTILFEDGKITGIGTNVTLPDGTYEKDITGKHVYPGLIDGATTMGIYEIGAVGMTVDINEQGLINPNAMVERAFNPESRWIGIARSAGILTSVTTPGGGLISGQSAAMMTDGWAWDQMTVKAGVGLIVNWPNPGNSDEYTERLEMLRDAFADARAYKNARRAMKSGDAPHHDFDSRWNAMIPVLDGNTPVVVNAHEVRQIQDAITWAEEEDVKLIILGGRDSHLITEHLKENDIPVIITEVLTSPNRAWEAYDSRYSLPAKLYNAGVEFAIAGEASAANANRLPLEAGGAAAFGLPEDVAVKALTLYPARILGLSDRIGALETGMDATLMITDGNPIEYSTQVEQVYIQGRKSNMMDSHRQFYKKYHEKVEQYRSQ